MKAIDSREVRRLIEEQDAHLVDVLPVEEYRREHITGAINVPLQDLVDDPADRLERSRPVIVYCHDYL